MRENGIVLKIISVLVAGVFLYQQVVWAIGSPANATNANAVPQHAESRADSACKRIHVSNDKAQVDDKHINGSKNIIINIQDCHSSLSAQYSIVEVLNQLLSNYNVDVVAVEGGTGYINTSILKTFPDKAIRNKTAEFLMEQGDISAGEFFAVTQEKDIALYGVEDNALYQENLKVFREIYSSNKHTISKINKVLENLKQRETEIYSRDLSRMVYKSRLHYKSKISFDVKSSCHSFSLFPI